MRNRSGLRNRNRNGKGTYHRRKKARLADRYGRFDNGIRLTPDNLTKWTSPEGVQAA